MRKLRVFYSDPDATDDSSDEDDRGRRGNKAGVKRVVLKVDLPDVEFPRKAAKQGMIPKKKEKKKRVSESPYKGVRRRKWGNWAAEIRNPFTKKRMWLGTFGSADAAREAYLAKRAEFDAEMAAAEAITMVSKYKGEAVVSPTSVLEIEGGSTSGSCHSGSTHDLDSGRLGEIGSAIIDKNGYLLGEFSPLDEDDLRICNADEGNN